MLICILVLILLPLTFLGIVLKTLFSPAELAEMGIYLEDAWTMPSQPKTSSKLLKRVKQDESGLASISICEGLRKERVLC
jgi:hypothetical protein